jgi:hypothetical protein
VLQSEWIDIAIGIVLVWFLLATTVSVVNELLNRVFAVRAKQLWHGLAQMLDGAKARGLIATTLRLPTGLLDTRPSNPQAAPTPGQDVSFAPKPADIPELDGVRRLYATQTIQALENHPDLSKRTRINHIPTAVFSQAIIEMAMVGRDAGGAIASFVEDLPTGGLKAQLEAIKEVAGNDAVKFRDGLERWFDGQMARLSAIYRSQVRIVLTVLGAVVVLAAFSLGLRVDSLGLASDLQRNENLRSAYANAGSAVSEATNSDLAAKGCPTTTATTVAASGATAPDLTCVAAGLSKIKGIDVAFAPADAARPGQSFGAGIVDRLSSLYDWRRILGLFVTVAALSFGAPFWWDVMRRLVGLRRSGRSTADNG